MIYKSIFVIFFFVIVGSNLATAELDVDGKNVCFKIVKKNETVQVKYTYPIEVTTFKICPRFPFTCRTKKTEFRIGIRPENRSVSQKLSFCCDGYIQDGEKCIPNCPGGCASGECLSPGVCDCTLGKGGENCNLTCPATKFGIACEYDCTCLTKPHCNKNYRDCSCKPGEIIPECRNICKCRSSICNSGFIGKNCEIPCPAGTFGSMCIGRCSCNEQNTLSCTKENGDCLCKPSFYGVFCEHACTDGKLVCETPLNCKCVIESKMNDKNMIDENKLHLIRNDNSASDSKNNSNSLIFGLIGLLLITIAISMLLLYKTKMKARQLKRDLHNYTVRYSTGSSNDHIDNPVYAYSSASTNIPSIGSNYYSGSTFAPSSIATATLPIRPRINPLNSQQFNPSLTVPRKPKQNGYLNELSLLPSDFLEKNALADSTNPNMINSNMINPMFMQTMKRDNTFGSNADNIYSTIDEKPKESYKEAFENEFKDDFSDHFDINEIPKSNNEPFKIPEDDDSIDFKMEQVTKSTIKNEPKHNQFNNDQNKDNFLQHYDQPNPKTSPIRSTYEVPKPFSHQFNPQINDLNKESINNHYDTLSPNKSYETFKK